MSGAIFPVGNDSVYLIAEAEINHNGKLETALEMVRAAKDSGADAIKFQYIVADEIATPGSHFHNIFRNVELSFQDFIRVRDTAESFGLDFFITAPSPSSLKNLDKLEPKFIKIGSTNITNLALLEGIALLGRPVILSTGASKLGDIEYALSLLNGLSVSLLHCTVKYPADFEDLNLRAIPTMRTAFPNHMVGYSDHSRGEIAAAMAVTLSARIIEKHFTLDKGMQGPDHAFSADPDEFGSLVAAVRGAEKALGNGIKAPVEAEAEVPKVARRFITAAHDITAGHVIDSSDLDYRRVEYRNGLVKSEQRDLIVGMQAPRDFKTAEPINWADFKAYKGGASCRS